MSVYYLKGQSNSGNTTGSTGYFYPLYTDESLISGSYHAHTFVGLDGEVFYMPNTEMNHAVENPPADSFYNGLIYQEYATYNVNNTVISYTNISTAQSQAVISIAADVDTFDPFNTNIENTESLRVEELIPEQLRASSENFISLVKDYYEYLNTEGLPTYETNRIIDEHDIDEVSEKYLDGIQGEIAKNIPDSNVMDRVSLYKKIIQYYTLKGSEESITTFFRLFFDEIIKVSYPKDKLFELSAGDWRQKNDEFTTSFTASITTEDLGTEYNWTPFQLKNDEDLVLGVGNIISVEETILFDAPPSINSLVFNLNAKQNLNSINGTWDSTILKKPIRGYFLQGANFNVYEDLVKLDGKNAFVDFGDIGDNPEISLDTEEHSFVIRTFPRSNKENTEIQPLFSLSKDYLPLHSHELFFNKNTNKLGRSFIDVGEPLITLDTSDQSLVFSNFIDQTSVGLSTLSDNRRNYINSFLSPLGQNFNGKWVDSGIDFNGGLPVYIHETDPVYNNITADDLSFYQFDANANTIDGPNNLKIGQSIYGEAANDFSGVNAISEDGQILAIGASKNDGSGTNSGSVRVYQLNGTATTWTKIGDDIDGDSASDLLGSDLSLNADGTILAVGAPEDKDSTDVENSLGEVKIFELISSPETWVQKGSSIVGDDNIEDSKLGTSVSLNGAGDRVAIGSGADPDINFDIGTQDENGILLEDFNGFGTVYANNPDWANVTDFVYDTATFTKSSSLINDRPRYDTSGGIISWQGSNWSLATFAGFGGTSTTVIHSDDTAYPWLNLDGTVRAEFDQFVPSLESSFAANGTEATISAGIYEFNTASTHIYVSGVSHQYDGLFEISTITTTDITYIRSGPVLTSDSFTIETGINPQFGTIDGGKTIGIREVNRQSNEAVVYEYSNSAWSQVGTNITEVGNDPLSGTTVRLSNDGKTILIGTHKVDDFGQIVMCVRAYFNASSTTTWNQIGEDLTFVPQAILNRGKIPLSLSNDGKRFAVGILGDETQEEYKGNVEIYSLSSQNKWVQLGQTLEGQNINDNFGSSVSLNTNGDVIVIGAPDNDESGNNSGHVQTFSYKSTLQSWEKVGATIQGFGDTGNAGASVSINGTGTRVVVGSPGNDATGSDRGKVDVFQVAIDATIGTFMHAEKNPLDTTGRWSIKKSDKTIYHTNWYDDISTVNPHDIKTRWIKSSKQGDANLPVLPHCEYVKNNNDHLFTLHNRGYLSIYYKHDDQYTPWQDITIGDTTVYDEERLWDILDYAVDGTHLVLLDRPIDGASRLVIFKLDEYNRYNFHQTVSLNLPVTHVGSADFAHLKVNREQIVVGTHTFNNTDIAQVIQIYAIGQNNLWSSENYLTLPSTSVAPTNPNLEFNISKNLTNGKWKSTDGLNRFESNVLQDDTLKDDGIKFNSSISSLGSGLGFNINSLNKFSLSVRFKSEKRFSDINNLLTIGNITLRIIRNATNPNGTLQIVSQESGKDDYPVLLDKTDTNIILDDNALEIFSDEYFNSQVKRSVWNNLIIEFTTNADDVITGLRYSLNGFKRSKSVDLVTNSPVHGITSSSQLTLHNNILFSHIAFYDKELTSDNFEAIERNLSSNYSETITTGINSLLDGGRFEINESGTVIIKVTDCGINIWDKISVGNWKNYYNTISSVTNENDDYITHNGSRLYSYKFFGDDLLIATGGLNNAKQFINEYNFSTVYNKAQHNSPAKLYYIKSQYTTSRSSWKLNQEFSPTIPFSQSNDDDLRIGLNYGVNIVIDNPNDSFAISLEPNSVNKLLSGPNSDSFSTENATDVKYDIWKKLSNNNIRSIPFIRPAEGFPEVLSYGGKLNNSAVLKIVDRSPSYNAVLSFPNIIHTTKLEKPMIEYRYDSDGNPIGYYKNTNEYNSDFVISTAPSSAVYSDTKMVSINEFNTIMVRGKADRYDGYIEISLNNSNFERIIEGNTIRHLIISPQANTVLGRNTNGYYNGDISHAQYYNGLISNANRNQITTFFDNNVKTFYKILFDRIEGTGAGATKITSMPTANKSFSLGDLNGHRFNSFLLFEQPENKIDKVEVDPENGTSTIIPQENTGLSITVDYGSVKDGSEVVYWGDGNLDTVLNNAPTVHTYGLQYLGEYFDKKGRASSVNKIQDSIYWQKFSYNIRSGLKVSDWENTFLNLVHPAGLRFFASVILLVIRDNHWYGPKSVIFDPTTRQNINLLRVEDEFLSPFRTRQPETDMRWLESLVAPSESGGYHLPIFQPGWLQGDIRVREFIFEAGLWTQLARSVPGNNLASKYTYSYFEDGAESGDIEFRLTMLNSPDTPFLVGDVVVQGEDIPDPNDTNSPARTLQRRGIIASIGPDGNEFTGIIKSYSIYDAITDGDISLFDGSPAAINTSKMATLTATKVKRKDEVIDVYGTEEQAEAYLLQDQSSININSEMFMRAVLTTFKYVIPSLVAHKEFIKNDWEQNLKFKDEGSIGPYLDLTIKGALSDRDVFINISSLIRKRNQLATEDDNGVYLERDSSPFGTDEGILLDDIVNFYNDPTNDYDVSPPNDFNIASYTGPQIVHGDKVYQDIQNDANDYLTIEGLVVGTSNSGNTISIAWRSAINTSASPDLTLPSKPELDQLFRAGEIYTIVGDFSSPLDLNNKTHQTEAQITVST